jgi:putative transposase
VLKIIGIPRSTYYYQKNYRVEEKKVSEGRPAPGYSFKEDGQKVSDEQIKEFLLEEIAGDGFNYGYRKLTKVLRRKYSLIINKKKVYRLCKELGVLRPQRQKKVSYPRKLARNRIIKGSNQLWEADIKYVAPVRDDGKSACSDAADKRCTVRYQPVHLVGKPHRGQ